MPLADLDERFMQQALEAAGKAFIEGEVPVGAVLVCEGAVVFSAYNLRESRRDPTAHAEMLVLQEASHRLGRWRLGGTLYCTLEPCVMCAGALVQARVDRLIFGASDPKAGGCGSIVDVVKDLRFNHRVEVLGGLMAEASIVLLQTFFRELRRRPREGDFA